LADVLFPTNAPTIDLQGCSEAIGAQGRNRTTDTVIFSHVLYQLSYLGEPWCY
jgi:hypothetical protein